MQSFHFIQRLKATLTNSEESHGNLLTVHVFRMCIPPDNFKRTSGLKNCNICVPSPSAPRLFTACRTFSQNENTFSFVTLILITSEHLYPSATRRTYEENDFINTSFSVVFAGCARCFIVRWVISKKQNGIRFLYLGTKRMNSLAPTWATVLEKRLPVSLLPYRLGSITVRLDAS